MKRTREQRHRDFWWGCLIVALTIVILCIASCVKNAAFIEAQSGETTTEAASVYIVYTDEQSHPYAALTYPHLLERAKPQFKLTDAERDCVAQIVAGQAVDRCLTAQTMIANVMYNQMLTTDGRIAGTEYAKCGRKTPTATTYEAVNAIFERGEWLLDDTVLWTGDADNPDAWHQTLRLVTTCDGIAFYEVAA